MAAYVTGNTTSLNAEELHHPAERHLNLVRSCRIGVWGRLLQMASGAHGCMTSPDRINSGGASREFSNAAVSLERSE